jgi:tetratricopeptide (TPR) repeat protein
VPPEDIPADTQSRADLFRTHTAGRRLLVVLDNARDIDQIRPLMPGAAGSLVLITSRTRFAGLATREGAMLLALDRPDISDAREDLRRRAGAQDTRDEDLDQIVAFCDRLPLAVSIVAARSRGRPGGIPELLADLRASHDSLDAFDDGALGGVRAVFSWSYRQLSPDAARLFRLLPLQTGPEAEVPLLASLAALPRRAVEQLVRELARTRLVSEPMPGRYTQHDLICVYATELSASLDTPAEREQAADRVLDHFTHTLNLMNMRHLKPALRTINGVPLPGVDPEDFPDAPSAVRWLRTELENLWAAVADAFARGRNPWPTVVDAFPAHNRLRRTLELEKPARQALDAAMAAGNRTAEGHLRNELGWLAGLDNRDEESPAQFTRALEIFDDLGVEVEQAAIRLSVAQWRSHLTPPDYAGAAPHFERAVALFRAHDHEFGTLLALGGLGRCRLELGRVAQGTTALTEALELSLRRGDLYQSAAMFWHLGAAGHRADAADFLLMSYRLYSDAGNRYWSMVTGVALAEAYFAAGRRWDAAGAWRRASRDCAAVAEAGQIPPGIRERLARLGEQLGVFADA